MGKNRERVRFCFTVFCFITAPDAAETDLRRIRGGDPGEGRNSLRPNVSRRARRRLSRLLRSGISSRGGTAPRDGVREHVRGALPGRRCRVPRAARVLRAPIQLGRRAPGPFGRRAPTLKDNLHVSARSVLTGRRARALRAPGSVLTGRRTHPPPPASTSFNTMERRRASPPLTAQGP